jgi:hypothetical protein
VAVWKRRRSPGASPWVPSDKVQQRRWDELRGDGSRGEEEPIWLDNGVSGRLRAF